MPGAHRSPPVTRALRHEDDEPHVYAGPQELTFRRRNHPVRIVAFTTEGWSRDVTADIAGELRRRYVEFGEVPGSILDFMIFSYGPR